MSRKIRGVIQEYGELVGAFVAAMILTFVFVFVLLGCAAPGVGSVPALMDQPVPGPLPYTPGRHPVTY